MDAPAPDQLISLAPSPSKPWTVCTNNTSTQLVQLEEYGSNIELMEPKTQRVTLNEPGPTDIAEGQSFITASEHCREHLTTNSAVDSNRSKLVQNDRTENYKSQAECLAVFQDIGHVLCKQLHQLQLTIYEAVSYPRAMIPHFHVSTPFVYA
jgi:hypothetical protein